MFDCNVIKSRAQKMQENQLPNLQPTVPQIPGMPMPTPFPRPIQPMPMMPGPAIRPMPGSPETTPPLPATPIPPASPMPSTPPMMPTAPLTPNGPAAPALPVPISPNLSPNSPVMVDSESLQYLNGYLKSQIGEYVEVEFLIGTSNRVIVYGVLRGVGINYILLEDPIAKTILACDFYNIKFVKLLPAIAPEFL